jgi:uracil-DNA glycosylase
LKIESPIVLKYFEQMRELFGDHIPMQETNMNNSQALILKLNNLIKDCEKCELSKTRTNFVFGTGNPNADIVFVGEAPGKEEDLQGKPFVGRSGKLLDKMFEAINLTRDDVFILNVLKCRPPENRDPSTSEIKQCKNHLKKQLEIINPKLIVALGRIAAKTLLEIDKPLKDMREKLFKYEGVETIVTYHPAALLRNPNFKKGAWIDFQKIRDDYLNRE